MKFHLLRYFAFTTLWVFVLVIAALSYFEGQQSEFFTRVQNEDALEFKNVQENFAKRQDEAARRDLLQIHEAGNVNLTRLFANSLWERDFVPFMSKVQFDVEPCRAIADVKDPQDGKMKAPKEKKECFAAIGQKIIATKGFNELNAKVFDMMKKSTVFKIKVFDLRGITVYSSEHAQIGEDKSFNAGWQSAAFKGKPASELTHRGKFSAFEGVVENRDLIGSYLPVLAPGSEKTVGVFEVYSDVTPFLAQIKETSAQIRKTAAANEARLAENATVNLAKVEESSTISLGVAIGILVLLYAVQFSIVRRAQKIIEANDKERQNSQQQLAQAEKMASLGQMVAGVAHQLNTPIAFSSSNVIMIAEALKGYELPLRIAVAAKEGLAASADGNRAAFKLPIDPEDIRNMDVSPEDLVMMGQMLDDVTNGLAQMAELVENLRDFTRIDRAKMGRHNINKSLKNVVYIAKSVIKNEITVVEDYQELPEIECNPSQLNQVFLNLVTNASHAIQGAGTITVRSQADGEHIRIDISDSGTGIPPDVLPHIFDLYYTTKPEGEGTGQGLAIASDIVKGYGGEISVATELGKGTTFTVRLPIKHAA